MLKAVIYARNSFFDIIEATTRIVSKIKIGHSHKDKYAESEFILEERVNELTIHSEVLESKIVNLIASNIDENIKETVIERIRDYIKQIYSIKKSLEYAVEEKKTKKSFLNINKLKLEIHKIEENIKNANILYHEAMQNMSTDNSIILLSSNYNNLQKKTVINRCDKEVLAPKHPKIERT